MKIINILLYLSLSAFILTSPYAMETDEANDPPLFYQSKSLVLSKLIDIDTTKQGLTPEDKDQSNAHGRIEGVLETLERMPVENDVLSLIFQDCIFETVNYLGRLLESCLPEKKTRFKALKSISFKFVIFSQTSDQFVDQFKKLKRYKVDFTDCGISNSSEEYISQDVLDKAEEIKDRIFARYAQNQGVRTIKIADVRAFSRLWDVSQRYLPTSPRFMAVPEEDQKSPRKQSDEGVVSQERAQAARQISEIYAKDLPPQSTLVSAAPNLRARAELQRMTSTEVSSSPRLLTELDEEEKSQGSKDSSTSG